MIRYALVCGDCDHRFDAWFSNAAAYDTQAAKGLIDCPSCSGHRVTKAIMAPAIGGKAAEMEKAAAAMALLRAMTAKVKATAEPVGERFADEARRIHNGESEERPIWGKATREEAEALADEGIEVAALPDFPDHDA
ncbi:MAG: DUF1178 family protein [Geminicoccaceae bacterium]|nr:MAG: DUF1178 family protein [Geminicoccaceae bacterium]